MDGRLRNKRDVVARLKEIEKLLPPDYEIGGPTERDPGLGARKGDRYATVLARLSADKTTFDLVCLLGRDPANAKRAAPRPETQVLVTSGEASVVTNAIRHHLDG